MTFYDFLLGLTIISGIGAFICIMVFFRHPEIDY